jgi:hypothetical protein
MAEETTQQVDATADATADDKPKAGRPRLSWMRAKCIQMGGRWSYKKCKDESEIISALTAAMGLKGESTIIVEPVDGDPPEGSSLLS